MPLEKGKGKAPFRSNLKRLMAEGYPQKQALAISYSVQRRSGGKGDKKGGKQ